MFTTGDHSRWSIMNKDAVIGWYSNGYRAIIKSSRNSDAHQSRMYRRNTCCTEDPWLSLGNYNDEVIYGANSYPGNYHLPYHYQGAKVYIRDSSANPDFDCLGPHTVENKMSCSWTPANYKLIQSSRDCRTNSFILDRKGSGFLVHECN
jgi:hypothetical protein